MKKTLLLLLLICSTSFGYDSLRVYHQLLNVTSNGLVAFKILRDNRFLFSPHYENNGSIEMPNIGDTMCIKFDKMDDFVYLPGTICFSYVLPCYNFKTYREWNLPKGMVNLKWLVFIDGNIDTWLKSHGLIAIDTINYNVTSLNGDLFIYDYLNELIKINGFNNKTLENFIRLRFFNLKIIDIKKIGSMKYKFSSELIADSIEVNFIYNELKNRWEFRSDSFQDNAPCVLEYGIEACKSEYFEYWD